MCAIYGLFLYFFNPPKTLLVSISAVFCLLMIIFMDSANIIRELRKSINLTRKEFSEQVGISIRTLEDWEAERRGCS